MRINYLVRRKFNCQLTLTQVSGEFFGCSVSRCPLTSLGYKHSLT
ncbi:hypothetical protein TcasGA2_TC034889 [Tribolium castaneum]|uniref:Uncharacterized protein n=1 Tax=Tribolium castaneum TaxID=7070 RepID=A0A139WBP7_TRICA|nr:hypothetical protein TcasGA2_TC034889 [Tribolium castaneum]